MKEVAYVNMSSPILDQNSIMVLSIKLISIWQQGINAHNVEKHNKMHLLDCILYIQSEETQVAYWVNYLAPPKFIWGSKCSNCN